MELFRKGYDGETLYDLERDVTEAVNPVYNDKAKKIPVDEYGIQAGRFIVSIEWVAE